MMADEPPRGRNHQPDDDHRKGAGTTSRDPSLGKLLLADIRNRYRRNPGRIAGIAVGSALLIALGVVAILVFGIGGDGDPRTDTAAVGSTPAAAPAPAPRPPHQATRSTAPTPNPSSRCRRTTRRCRTTRKASTRRPCSTT